MMAAMAGRDPIDLHVGDRLRLARRACGLAQREVAQSLGISFQQLQKYEKGLSRISAGRLFRLAVYFDVPLGFFYDDMPTALRHMVSDIRGSNKPDLAPLGGLHLGAENRNREVLRLVSGFLKIPDSKLRAELVAFVMGLRESFADRPSPGSKR